LRGSVRTIAYDRFTESHLNPVRISSGKSIERVVGDASVNVAMIGAASQKLPGTIANRKEERMQSRQHRIRRIRLYIRIGDIRRIYFLNGTDGKCTTSVRGDL
jgi:hypothetical protein